MNNLKQKNQIKLTMINDSSGKMNNCEDQSLYKSKKIKKRIEIDYIIKEKINYANKTSIVNNMLFSPGYF